MTLREFLNTCGNDWRFVKIYFNNDEDRDFDANRPDRIYSDAKFIPEATLQAKVDKWYLDKQDMNILLGGI